MLQTLTKKFLHNGFSEKGGLPFSLDNLYDGGQAAKMWASQHGVQDGWRYV